MLSLGIGTLISLAGCDTLNDWLAPDRVNYKGAETAPTLTVPSDLSTADISQRYAAPPKLNTLGGAAPRALTPAGNATVGVPSPQDPFGMHVERDGDRRWLVVDGRSPDQLWPQLQEFWEENGFTLKTDAAATGIMTTDWAEKSREHSGRLVQEEHRQAGRLLAYSSGTRDRFQYAGRARLGWFHWTSPSVTARWKKCSPSGTRHRRKWVERRGNPALEAAFLAKLMEKFGLTDAQAKQLLTDARPASATASVDTTGGSSTLDLSEPFDSAWLRVGLALDRTNFTVDNRDRAKGLYYVRFSDSMQELKKEGLLGKLFAGSTPKPTREFMVNVRPKADTVTQIAVVDANGQVDTSTDAQRIVALLHAQLN